MTVRGPKLSEHSFKSFGNDMLLKIFDLDLSDPGSYAGAKVSEVLWHLLAQVRPSQQFWRGGE